MPALPQSVLVVEDEYFIADDMASALESCGIEVVGPVASSEDALRLIGERAIDGAILDVNLNGTVSPQIADALRAADVPFLFVTGYDPDALGPQFGGVPHLRKPISANAVITALKQLLRQRVPVRA